MGLDQYAYRVKRKEIAYWRKHNRLQGWFEKKWHELGNEEDFNCKDLYLDEEMLNELEDAIKNDKLPKTEGFFFGSDSYDQEKKWVEEQKRQDLNFVKEAREILRKGEEQVVYTCWW